MISRRLVPAGPQDSEEGAQCEGEGGHGEGGPSGEGEVLGPRSRAGSIASSDLSLHWSEESVSSRCLQGSITVLHYYSFTVLQH